MGIEIDTHQFKFGDGSTTWNSLNYAGASAGSFKYGVYTLSVDQTNRISVGNHIEFDTTQGSLGGLSIGSGQANGVISLAGGKTYKITGGVTIQCSAAGSAQLKLFDVTNSANIKHIQPLTTNNNQAKSSMPYVQAIISPTSDIDVEVQFSVLSKNIT